MAVCTAIMENEFDGEEVILPADCGAPPYPTVAIAMMSAADSGAATMNQPTPAVPGAASPTLRLAWWQSKTVWIVVTGIIAGFPALADKLDALPLGLATWQENLLLVISLICAQIAPLLARIRP